MPKKVVKKEDKVDQLDTLQNITLSELADTEEDDLDITPDEFFDGLEKDLEDLEKINIDEPVKDEDGVVDTGEDVEDSEVEDKLDEDSDTGTDDLSKYKEYIPLLEAMARDENLVNLVSNYLVGEPTEPVTKEQETFEIPEDLVFDFEEALRDPDSDSAKVLKQYTDSRIRSAVDNAFTTNEKKVAIQEQTKSLKDKYGLDDSDINELINWTKATPMTLEDAYFLKNRGKISKKIAKKAIEDVIGGKKKSKGSLASKGAPGTAREPESEMFKLIQDALEFKMG